MRLYYLFSFILLSLSTFVYGQKNFEKGYIVNSENDTLVGYVKDRKPHPFAKLYTKVYFKKKHNKRRYGPNQIRAYQQGIRTYESMWVDVSGHLINETYSAVPNRGKKEFLRVIVKGSLTYYQREFMDTESDYIDYISLFKRADEDTYIRVMQGIFGFRIKSLKLYFNDCPELLKKIENGQLKTPKEIALYYNTCKTKKSIFN